MTFDLAQMIAKLRDPELIVSRTNAADTLECAAAEIIRLTARVAELEGALAGCVAAIEHADMSDGVCCCGDNMEGHSDPMNCGHSPTDMGEYHASQVLSVARAALSTHTEEQKT